MGQATFLATFSVVHDGRLPVCRPEGLPAVHLVQCVRNGFTHHLC
jgi:hypothetical protein